MLNIDELLASHGGIRLDIGCGQLKQSPAWVGLDLVDYPGVTDIVWDVNFHPWPLPDECVITAVCSHLIEHIPPVMFRVDGSTRFPFMEFMDEVWRIMKPDGEFAIAMPHGYSQFYIQDPTHCNPCNETTWAYFDPLEPKTGGALYKFYKPLPWKIKALSWDPGGNMEVVLIKRREDKSYYE
jgi:hypothetical protein